MANFAVDPTQFVPEGLEIEDWARPARGRIVINGNPPRRHDEYAIVSLAPLPRRTTFMRPWKKSWHFWKRSSMRSFAPAVCLPGVVSGSVFFFFGEASHDQSQSHAA
jgi:hypothetical protein